MYSGVPVGRVDSSDPEPEVREDETAPGVAHHVGRLHVAMNEPSPVNCRERRADLHAEPSRVDG
jgi:hypothetical protein